MDKDDEELAKELRGLLSGSGYKTSFGDEQSDSGSQSDEAQS